MPAPDAPTGLTCTVDSEKRPRLAWAATPGATVWQVCDLAGEKLVQATVTVPHSTRSPMKPGQRREYGIRAYGSGGISPMSGTVIVTCDRKGKVTVTPGAAPAPTPAPTPAAPQVPTGLDVVIGQDMRPVLTWDSAAGVDSWDVRDSLNPAVPIQETVSVPRSVRSALRPGSPARAYAVRARNAVGTSLWCLPVLVPAVPDTTPTPTPTPTPTAPPAVAAPGDLLDLSRWYLTLPIADPSGKDASGPWDVHQPELATFTHPTLFHVADGAVEYVAPAQGVTTSTASGATRCELRETNRDGSLAAWAFADGKTHTLTCTLTCDGTSIEGRKEVIVGQIHGPGGTPPLILCVNHTRAALEVFRQGPRQGDLLSNLQPGQRFTYRIDASGGQLRLWACLGDAAELPEKPAFDWSAATVLAEQSGLYFKCGSYNKQQISTATTGQSIVRHYRCDLA